MNYEQLPPTLLIKKEWKPLAICEIVQPYFVASYPEQVIEWSEDAYMLSVDEEYESSASFKKLLKVINEDFFELQPYNKATLIERVEKNSEYVRMKIEPLLKQSDSARQKPVKKVEPVTKVTEPPKKIKKETQKSLVESQIKEISDPLVKKAVEMIQKEEIPTDLVHVELEQPIERIIEKEHLYSNSSSTFQILRDLVTKPDFTKNENGTYSKDILGMDGSLQGQAEIRTNEEIQRLPADTVEKKKVWFSLMESAITSLDELSADLFDLISYLWMVSSKNSEGYIHFESDEALKLKYADPYRQNFKTRERERFAIMQRVAALSSVWIAVENDDFIIVNEANLEDRTEYDLTNFQPMFQIGSLEMAYDKKTGKAKGIYSLTIKPSSLLAYYLTDNTQAFGYLDYKVFQYNYYQKRPHKRLVRFLNYEWKVRTEDLLEPFTVEALNHAMDLNPRYTGSKNREKLETVLDELMQDSVIKSWYYETQFTDAEIADQRYWYKNEWQKVQVVILPPDVVVEENRKLLIPQTISNEIYTEAKQEKERRTLSPEMLKEIKEVRNIPLSVIAEEANVSYSAVQRYLKTAKLPKKKETVQQLEQWVNEWYVLTQEAEIIEEIEVLENK
ncbi:XRE family transcriptional regulator [Kurthia populi]|uniref:XRE family transcriptional regulator n=1 Tax=Kurthia populi TaxID=1562132 RepID=A0ABW5Y3R1_9BACL